MEAAQLISDQCGNKPLIVSLANGQLNPEILPEYFSKIIYGVILHNAWRDIEYIEKKIN